MTSITDRRSDNPIFSYRQNDGNFEMPAYVILRTAGSIVNAGKIDDTVGMPICENIPTHAVAMFAKHDINCFQIQAMLTSNANLRFSFVAFRFDAPCCERCCPASRRD